MQDAGFGRMLEHFGGPAALREYADASEDEMTIVNIDHSRRPKLTLRHLGKLRRTRAVERMEKAQRRKDVFALYGPEMRE